MPTARSFLLLCLCWCGLISTSQADHATVAVASNFRLAMSELIKAFEQSHSHQLKQVNAASGLLFHQIVNGAPFDVFLSANSLYPMLIEKQGLGSDRINYATGQLVLASRSTIPPEKTAMILTLQQLIASDAKVAIAHPEIAPYGIAAKQFLQHLALWPLPRGTVVRGNNINQAFQYIATGNAQIGLVALSQMLYLNDASMHYLLLPPNSYQPIQQQAIVLQSGRHNPAALAFMVFLRSQQALDIIQRHGYLVAE